VVTRAAFADALRSLNFTLSDDEVYEVARLFELRPGAVHYRAFLGYAVEGDRSSALRAAENKARTLLKRHGKGRDLRAVFAKYDAEARGVITQREFARALADVDCRLSEAELRHLFDRIDPADAGIKYMAFSAFIHAAPEPVPPAPDLADEATDRELQRKCYLCVAEAVGRLPAYEGEMLGQFVHYDWRRKGHVAESEFATSSSAASRCAGARRAPSPTSSATALGCGTSASSSGRPTTCRCRASPGARRGSLPTTGAASAGPASTASSTSSAGPCRRRRPAGAACTRCSTCSTRTTRAPSTRPSSAPACASSAWP